MAGTLLDIQNGVQVLTKKVSLCPMFYSRFFCLCFKFKSEASSADKNFQSDETDNGGRGGQCLAQNSKMKNEKKGSYEHPSLEQFNMNQKMHTV